SRTDWMGCPKSAGRRGSRPHSAEQLIGPCLPSRLSVAPRREAPRGKSRLGRSRARRMPKEFPSPPGGAAPHHRLTKSGRARVTESRASSSPILRREARRDPYPTDAEYFTGCAREPLGEFQLTLKTRAAVAQDSGSRALSPRPPQGPAHALLRSVGPTL